MQLSRARLSLFCHFSCFDGLHTQQHTHSNTPTRTPPPPPPPTHPPTHPPHSEARQTLQTFPFICISPFSPVSRLLSLQKHIHKCTLWLIYNPLSVSVWFSLSLPISSYFLLPCSFLK